MKEDVKEYEDLLQQMQGLPKAAPPGDFTVRLMSRLPVGRQTLWSRVKQTLLNPVVEDFHTGWFSQQAEPIKTECSFYFFVTGFFYLIIGLILLAGIRTLGSEVSVEVSVADWLRLQPLLTFGTAIWLMVLGLLLLLDGKIAVKTARYGTFFYILFVTMNGILVRPYFQVPYADIFIIGFVGGGVCMGLMLAHAVQKMALWIVEGD